jgi:hypothetical protein
MLPMPKQPRFNKRSAGTSGKKPPAAIGQGTVDRLP